MNSLLHIAFYLSTAVWVFYFIRFVYYRITKTKTDYEMLILSNKALLSSVFMLFFSVMYSITKVL